MKFDVLILGGGPAGAAAAVTLAQGGRRVAVVRRTPGGSPGAGETLSADALPTLEGLGLLARFGALPKVDAPGVLSLWGHPEPLSTDGFARPLGHGWHLDRGPFDATLADAARDAGATLLDGSPVLGVIGRPGPDGAAWTLLAKGVDLEAPVVIDATGRRRWLVRRLGVAAGRDDRLVALSAVGPAPGAPDDRLVMEAEPDGWWYTTPLPGGRRLVALLTDHDLLPRDPGVRAADWSSRLAATRLIAGRVGPSAARLVPRTFPAGTGRAGAAAGPGWFAVGDAARTVDPLSGLGLCRALDSGRAAALAALDGSAGAARAYASAVDEGHRADRDARTRLYGAVSRWPDRPFWARRRGGAATSDRSDQLVETRV